MSRLQPVDKFLPLTVLAITILCATGCQSAPKARVFSITPPGLMVGPAVVDSLTVRGLSPDWRLYIVPGSASLAIDGQTLGFPAAAPSTLQPGPQYIASQANRTLGLSFEEVPCQLADSPVTFPRRFHLMLDNRLLTGCGGEPAVLLQGPPWALRATTDLPLAPDGAILLFGRNGRLGGRLPCGSLSGLYSATAEGLRIQRATVSPAICPASLHGLDAQVLERLGRIDGFSVPVDGELQFTAAGRPLLYAVRRP